MDMDMDMDMDVDMDMDMDIDVYHRPNLELACNVGSRLYSLNINNLCNININFDIQSITIIIMLCHAELWGHSSHNIPNEAKVTECPKETSLTP